MTVDTPIEFFDRYQQKMITEDVYGESFLRWIYGTPSGRLALAVVASRPAFSKWYGWRMSRPASARMVTPFVEEFGLDPAEFADEVSSYGSFNEFFFRKLKPEARPVDSDRSSVVFPADGRHLCLPNVTKADSFFVKGQRFDLEKLLGCKTLAARFENGSLLLSRLCPTDYHRYHFPVSGDAAVTRELNERNRLYSVSPIALRQRLDYLWENKRTLTLVESPGIGEVAVLEIGATCVGSIHQTYDPGTVAKGDEKGYFSFGGSSVITLFPEGSITFSDDLVEWSSKQTEVYARVGDICARVN
ncbi:archaetidylserine decarboxylase [Sulfuriroseicoccus oceanibius]|uniref:phosphatidylserine decarboxylase n=1 Tax=Sulfuriroseicoccus oceanibius TaxID=2707525 RepID=A0A6B3LB03_9BACT|nr:archaetidylserine decarboxylase [Sulfuriroseicoccus oceanibius]QQL44029.1 phosphatidylserine decarboxylase [Sulfuriroseicoccus oceanibius]